MTVFALMSTLGGQLASNGSAATSSSDIFYSVGPISGWAFNSALPPSGGNAGLSGPSTNPALFTSTSPLLISLGTTAKKANQLAREAASSAILNQLGWTIDPDDIYIPFASD